MSIIHMGDGQFASSGNLIDEKAELRAERDRLKERNEELEEALELALAVMNQLKSKAGSQSSPPVTH